jgi:hypothetical protein
MRMQTKLLVWIFKKIRINNSKGNFAIPFSMLFLGPNSKAGDRVLYGICLITFYLACDRVKLDSFYSLPRMFVVLVASERILNLVFSLVYG